MKPAHRPVHIFLAFSRAADLWRLTSVLRPLTSGIAIAILLASVPGSVNAQTYSVAPGGGITSPSKPKPKPAPTPGSDPTYYWNGTGAINNVTSWGQNTDGSGTQPSTFTAAGQVFEFQSGQSAVLGGAWTVSGSSSKVLVDTGATLDSGTNNPTMILDLQSGATYKTSNGYTNLTLGTISSGSTFDYYGTAISFRNSLAYGGLIWRSSTPTGTPGSFTTTGLFTLAANTAQVVTTTATSNTWTIGTDVTINSTTTLALAPNSASSSGNATVNIDGGLTNNGTISKGAASTGTATFNFNGTGSSNVTWGTNSGNFNVNVSSATKTIAMSDSLNNGTGTVGVTGTLNLGNGSKLNGTGTITVNSGGTLVLAGTTGGDRINNNAGVTLAGGTFKKADALTEGSSSAVGMGALTLTASGSKIDFGGTSGTLTFTSFTPNSNVLSITNYIGTGSPGGTDQLIFKENESTRLSNFDFGFGAGVNVAESNLGAGFFEVYSTVPVPEPSTWIAGALALGAVGWTQRRRLSQLVRCE